MNENDRDGKVVSAAVDEDELQAFVDGRLAAARARAVERQMAADPRFAARVAALQRQRALLHEIGAALGREDARGFQPTLQLTLAQTLRRQAWWRNGLRGAAAVAAGVLLVVGLHAGWQQAGRLWSPTPTVMAEAGHEFPFGSSFLAPAARTPSDEIDAALKFLNSRLEGVRLTLPDLAALDLKPVGGGILARSHAPAVRFNYHDAANREIILYVGVTDDVDKLAIPVVGQQFVSLNWVRKNLVLAVIGEETHDLMGVMRAVNTAILATGSEAASLGLGATAAIPAAVEGAALLPAAPVGRVGGEPLRAEGVPPAMAPQPVAPVEPAPAATADAKQRPL